MLVMSGSQPTWESTMSEPNQFADLLPRGPLEPALPPVRARDSGRLLRFVGREAGEGA